MRIDRMQRLRIKRQASMVYRAWFSPRILAAFLIGFWSWVYTAAGQTPTVAVNELMASNSSSTADPQGQYDDWIEIYNYGNSTVHLGGMYLTDNLSAPTKWKIPDDAAVAARNHIVIWADNDTGDAGLHANFKLDADGDQIALFDRDGVTLIDSIVFGAQTADVSYGCYPDGGDDRRFFAIASPGARNHDGYIGRVADTEFSHKRGFYDAPFSVTIATETEGATIHYTLDGSAPITDGLIPTGAVYTGPIQITTTTVLRAVATKPGWKSSDMDSQTYIFLDDVLHQRGAGFPNTWGHVGADYEMDPEVVNDWNYSNTIKDDLKSVPTMSLAMDVVDWFGGSSSVSQGGVYAHPQWEDRYGPEAERAVSVEYYDPSTSEQFQIEGGVRLAGGSSTNPWKMDKLSMRLKFTEAYGPTKLRFDLFGDDATDQFDTLVLDARMNNSWAYGGGVKVKGSRPWISGTVVQRDVAQYTRDQYVADIQNAMGGYGPHGRHVHLYINGLYWGLYWIHERPDEHFAAAYLGGEDEDYDALKHNSGTVINGSGADYNRMFNIANGGLSSDAKYREIQQYLDVPNLIDYMITNFYVGNTDWAHQNWYATRSRVAADGRWRYHSWDAEHVMEGLTENSTGRNNNGGPTRLHHQLAQNGEYRMLFADHVHRHFFNDGVLTPSGAAALYQIRLDEVDRAVVGESARWGDNHSSRPYTRDVDWVRERDWLLNQYFPQRTQTVLNQFKSRGWYPDVDAPTFRINGVYQHGGRIAENSLLSMTGTAGTIWYTLDGSDPRRPAQSGRNENPTTTLAPESAVKRVLVPTGPIDPAWNTSETFRDSTWSTTTGGIGYERGSGYDQYIDLDVESQMYRRNGTCYIRIPFVLEGGLDEFDFVTLKIRRDDGFIAYLNGTEVARRNFTGTPRWNSSAASSTSDSLAVQFEEIDISAFLSNLRRGDNLLAIHGLNTSITSSDFLISAELVAGQGGSGGDVQPGAHRYTGPFVLTESANVKARALSGNTWSALNEAAFAVGPVAENLRITEIMYHPQDPNEEFIELTNIGPETVNLNLVSFSDGIDFTFPSFAIAGDEQVVIVRDRNIFEARYGANVNVAGEYSGRLNNAGERITLVDAIGQRILDFEYKDGWRSITDGEGFSLTVTDPKNPDPDSWNLKDSWRASAYVGGSPGTDDSGIIPEPDAVLINELLAHSHDTASDWIELYNTTDAVIDIGGWFLSDSGDNPFKFEVAAGTTIGPGEYVVFYQDMHFGNANNPGCHTPFALSENGEGVYLNSAQNGVLTGYRDVQDFGASETGVSFGRYYKESTDNYNFVAMEHTTPGEANAYPKVGPIVISEIMYHPVWPSGEGVPPLNRQQGQDGLATTAYTNEQYEYIELQNISAQPATLYDYDKGRPWKFTDGVEFEFDADSPVTIDAGECIVIVNSPAAFSRRYPEVATDKIFGPYDGKLSNSGERLEISRPADVDASGEPQYIRVDRVNYSDGSHHEDVPGSIDLWPLEADGGGLSLTRITPIDYGNDPQNWIAAESTPGK